MSCLQTTSNIEKCVIFAFVILPQIKEIVANRHEKLNRLMIAQTPQLFRAKFIKIGL